MKLLFKISFDLKFKLWLFYFTTFEMAVRQCLSSGTKSRSFWCAALPFIWVFWQACAKNASVAYHKPLPRVPSQVRLKSRTNLSRKHSQQNNTTKFVMNVQLPEVESRTQGSRPRTQKNPRPGRAFPWTNSLETKDTSTSVLQKKRSSKIFFRRSPKKRKKMSSKFFFMHSPVKNAF